MIVSRQRGVRHLIIASFCLSATTFAIADPTDECYSLYEYLAGNNTNTKTCPGIGGMPNYKCYETRTSPNIPPPIWAYGLLPKSRAEVEYLDKCNEWSSEYTASTAITCVYNRFSCGSSQGECVPAGTSASVYFTHELRGLSCCH